jgi:hypothetical protein
LKEDKPIMETIKLNARAGADGVIKLELPTGVSGREFEILVILNPLEESEAVDEMGYPIGYFDETYGSFADDPLERGVEPPVEQRDKLE